MSFIRDSKVLFYKTDSQLPTAPNTDYQIMVDNGAALTLTLNTAFNSFPPGYTVTNVSASSWSRLTSTARIYGWERVNIAPGGYVSFMQVNGTWVATSWDTATRFGEMEMPHTNWSYINKGASVFGRTSNFRFFSTTVGGGSNQRYEVRPIPKTSNYTYTVNFSRREYTTVYSYQNDYIGLVLTDGTKLITLGTLEYYAGPSRAIQTSMWNTFSSHSYNLYSIDGWEGNDFWARVRDDGTYRYYETSADGITWTARGSELKSPGFLTPTHIGWGGYRNTNTNFFGANLMSYKFTSQ